MRGVLAISVARSADFASTLPSSGGPLVRRGHAFKRRFGSVRFGAFEGARFRNLDTRAMSHGHELRYVMSVSTESGGGLYISSPLGKVQKSHFDRIAKHSKYVMCVHRVL